MKYRFLVDFLVLVVIVFIGVAVQAAFGMGGIGTAAALGVYYGRWGMQ